MKVDGCLWLPRGRRGQSGIDPIGKELRFELQVLIQPRLKRDFRGAALQQGPPDALLVEGHPPQPGVAPHKIQMPGGNNGLGFLVGQRRVEWPHEPLPFIGADQLSRSRLAADGNHDAILAAIRTEQHGGKLIGVLSGEILVQHFQTRESARMGPMSQGTSS